MKRHVLLYGLIGGVLIAVLRWIDYRFLVIEHSFEIYGAMIATLFAGLGIWLGLKITNPKNGKSVICRVNDRGPARRLRRLIDMSRASFQTIAPLKKGLIPVVVKKVEPVSVSRAQAVS